jgi:hypothetical protein
MFLYTSDNGFIDFLDGANKDEATTFTISMWHIREAQNVVSEGENMFSSLLHC